MSDALEQTIDAMPTVKSVNECQDEILRDIIQLHCPEGFDLDMTYGNGVFWRQLPKPKWCFDISPQCEGVEEADCRAMPLDLESVQNAIFDPPFLTYIKNGRDHKDGKVAMAKRFGGFYSFNELTEHYRDSLSEAWRVLKYKGKLVFKCQDIVHNHKLHSTHYMVMMMAEMEGFSLKDTFILTARRRMPSPQKGTQRHARVFHSHFLVFEKPSKASKRIEYLSLR